MANKLFKDKRFIFITGSGRCGTKWITNYLTKACSQYAFHEPSPDLLDLSLNVAHKKISDKEAWDKFIKSRMKIIRDMDTFDKKVYIESNNRLFPMLDILDKNIENCTFVHLVRDGRDVVRSAYNFWKSGEYEDTPRINCRNFPSDDSYPDWGTYNTFSKVTWWWKKKVEMIEDAKADKITVKIESLTDSYNNFENMRNLLGRLGLPQNIDQQLIKEKVHAFNSFEMPRWYSWSFERRIRFDVVAKRMMERLGYY